MSKWYEVTVQAWKVVVVEIEDDTERDPEDEAMEIARDEAFSFCQEIEVVKIEKLDTPERIEQAKRHADEISECEA